jgi:putative PIN family toxin of toxin-antitoxin system
MRVFLDANCLFSAIYSPSGGSGEIVRRSELGEIQVVVSREVIKEAARNIRKKMGRKVILQFLNLLLRSKVERCDPTSSEEEARWRGVTSEKDCHILAGALKAHADALISLDKKHILTEQVRSSFPIPVVSPGEFLTSLPGEGS